VRRIGSIKRGEDVVGNRTAVKVVKNKMAPPFAKVEFDIMFGQGISRIGDILDLAAKYEIVDKSGAWYGYKGERIGQGRDNTVTFLTENPKMADEMRAEVLARTLHKDKVAAAPTAEAKEAKDSKEKETLAKAAAGKKAKH
jgi:recombination protein RecA